MMNEPTNSAMKANTSRNVLRKPSRSFTLLALLVGELLAGQHLVLLRVGRGRDRLPDVARELLLRDTRLRGDVDGVPLALVPDEPLRGARRERDARCTRGAAAVTELEDADELERLGTGEEDDRDLVAELVAGVARGLVVEHDVVGRDGSCALP